MTSRGDAGSRLPVVRSLLPVLGLGACLVVGACGTSRLPPPDGAPPEVVARAYLEALVSGDCTATRALLANDDDPARNDLCGMGRVETYRALTGPAGTEGDVSLGVTLVLRDMPRGSGWEDGEATVFLHLVRGAGGPWRGQGVGSGP